MMPPYQNIFDPNELCGIADLDQHAPFYGRVKLMDGREFEGTIMSVDEDALRFRSAMRVDLRYHSFVVEDIMRIKVYRPTWQRVFSMASHYETVYDMSEHGEVHSCLSGIDWVSWPHEGEWHNENEISDPLLRGGSGGRGVRGVDRLREQSLADR